mmetsp:Transcript_28190/g.65249  ORF Transcript_28190/g.65249 Transcript_28190/m.65249 type:complete len:84 (-) Transcript_28190:667-918(-)
MTMTTTTTLQEEDAIKGPTECRVKKHLLQQALPSLVILILSLPKKVSFVMLPPQIILCTHKQHQPRRIDQPIFHSQQRFDEGQ